MFIGFMNKENINNFLLFFQAQLSQLLLPYQDLFSSAPYQTTSPLVTSTAHVPAPPLSPQTGLNQFSSHQQTQPVQTSLNGYSLAPAGDQLTQALQSYGVSYVPSLAASGKLASILNIFKTYFGVKGFDKEPFTSLYNL